MNAFLQQFSANIKFDYICFDRVIIRGYIRSLFFEAGIVLFLRAMGFCRLTILTDKEPVRTFVSGELTSQAGKRYHRLYKCRKPVKQYYIYFHDQVLGGPCYLKISSYLPFHYEFYFNGHNAVRLEVDKRGLAYTKKDNAFMSVARSC